MHILSKSGCIKNRFRKWMYIFYDKRGIYDKKNLINIRKFGENINNIIKKINSKLIYSKKYLIAKKNSTQQKAFNFFYLKVISVSEILIDSVYRKNEPYYPKVFQK